MHNEAAIRVAEAVGKGQPDHVDVKTGAGSVDLLTCVAGILSYQPGWVRFLYSVRKHLLRLLGHPSEGEPSQQRFTRDTLPSRPGEQAMFFTVVESDGEHLWVATGDESHLRASIGVTFDPQPNGTNLFHVVTLVHYHNLAGRLYFNLIRPFHHLVVVTAMRSVLRR